MKKVYWLYAVLALIVVFLTLKTRLVAYSKKTGKKLGVVTSYPKYIDYCGENCWTSTVRNVIYVDSEGFEYQLPFAWVTVKREITFRFNA